MVINTQNCEFNLIERFNYSKDCYCHRVITNEELIIPVIGGLLSGGFAGFGIAVRL
jgi:hypothetical protein